jgi:hypothetical protein
MKALAFVALLGALVQIGPAPTMVHETDKPAQISFNLPKNWVVDDEQTLFEVGFIVPPEPMYAVVASPNRTPYTQALLASSSPWALVTVETVSVTLPPAETYELAPSYLERLAANTGNSVTTLKTLVPHRPVHDGGLSGSTAATTVVSPGGSTSVDDLAYEKGGQLWLIVVGCSTSCYGQNSLTIEKIVNSVRVGTDAH